MAVCSLALCFGGGPVCLDEDCCVEVMEVTEAGEGERDVEGEEDLLGLGGGWVVVVREEDPVDEDLLVVACPSPMLKKSTI